MIGNDIVDLTQAAKDSNWKRKGFVNKVFTKVEQEYIAQSEDENSTVWGLWSAKEAAYKAHNREHGKRWFNPRKIECTVIKKRELSITYKALIGNNSYYINTLRFPKYVVSFALDSRLKSTSTSEASFSLSGSDYNTQHNQTYTQLYQFLANKFSWELQELSIVKNAFGVPNIFLNNQLLPNLLSISHHGKFAAVVIDN
jgi:phosphopantetheine--protein transferase-like protein